MLGAGGINIAYPNPVATVESMSLVAFPPPMGIREIVPDRSRTPAATTARMTDDHQKAAARTPVQASPQHRIDVAHGGPVSGITVSEPIRQLLAAVRAPV